MHKGGKLNCQMPNYSSRFSTLTHTYTERERETHTSRRDKHSHRGWRSNIYRLILMDKLCCVERCQGSQALIYFCQSLHCLGGPREAEVRCPYFPLWFPTYFISLSSLHHHHHHLLPHKIGRNKSGNKWGEDDCLAKNSMVEAGYKIAMWISYKNNVVPGYRYITSLQ